MNKLFITRIQLNKDTVPSFRIYPFNIKVVKNFDKLDFKSPVTFFIGENGVGKSTFAASIASAMNRKFVKISVGGLSDSAELVGHRKTYVGSSPGKIIDAFLRVKCNNPLILIDEVDKMISDYKGNPTATLLDILDTSLNNNFVDSYIEEPFDLSNTFFVLTANNVRDIPAELLDRLEIIELSSYTEYEKFEIAKRHLLPKIIKENAIKPEELSINEDAIRQIIRYYTREAGVRNLERLIAKICRQLAVKIVANPALEFPWVVTEKMLPNILNETPVTNHGVRKQPEVGVGYGLGWSPYGGSVLTLEGISIKGKGGLVITGNLKNVMKESCQIAHTVAKKYVLKNIKNPIDFSFQL